VQTYLKVKIAASGFPKKSNCFAIKKQNSMEGSMPGADYKISNTMINQARKNPFKQEIQAM
jgi:hypothetical protein